MDSRLDAARPTYRRLFGVGSFAQLATGALLARAANQMWQVALVLYALQAFRSPALTGGVVFLAIAPGLMLSPIAGALLDRHGRLRMILLDYALAALLAVALAALIGSGARSVPALLALVTFSSLTRPLSAAGTRSLFPVLVPPDLWERANAVDAGSDALGAVIGPALAGFALALAGPVWAFLLIGLLYAAGALATLYATEPSVPMEPAPLLASAWAALRYVVRHPTLRPTMYMLWLNNLGFGALTVALPVLVLHQLHGGDETVGALWAVTGGASVAAGIIVGRLDTRLRERQLLAFGMLAFSAGLVVMASGAGVLVLAVSMALVGISFGAVDVTQFSLRQRRTDPAWFGRAFAVAMSLNYAAVPAGSALAGPIVAISPTHALLAGALLALGAAAVALWAIPREG
jgi:MFS family permease